MKKLLIYSLILFFALGLTSCTSYMDEYYRGRQKINFYHGIKHKDMFISVEDFTPKEIEFKIRRLGNSEAYLYHIILDEDEERIAEGWYPTLKVGIDYYKVRMKAKKGFSFHPGIKYRFCIGGANPDLVYYRTNNYQCYVDYEFVLIEK
jgi:hypothetical protein